MIDNTYTYTGGTVIKDPLYPWDEDKVGIKLKDGTIITRTIKEIQDALELYDQYQEYKNNVAE